MVMRGLRGDFVRSERSHQAKRNEWIEPECGNEFGLRPDPAGPFAIPPADTGFSGEEIPVPFDEAGKLLGDAGKEFRERDDANFPGRVRLLQRT
jgi:hypothetical protein